MKVKLSIWGNSLAVRIPSSIAEQAKLHEGVLVDIEAVGDGLLRLTELKHAPSIEELVAKITDENRHEETDWASPVGNETW